jgi:hypothetical protein
VTSVDRRKSETERLLDDLSELPLSLEGAALLQTSPQKQNKNFPNKGWGWFGCCGSPSAFVALPAAEQKRPVMAIERGRAGK